MFAQQTDVVIVVEHWHNSILLYAHRKLCFSFIFLLAPFHCRYSVVGFVRFALDRLCIVNDRVRSVTFYA